MPDSSVETNIEGLNQPFVTLLVKRFLDVCVSLLVLAIIWPILLVVSLAVKFSSPGPVFYRGVRTGFKGDKFHILKFRTMVPDAETCGGPTTGTNDPRITAIGHILRKTKFDELPQFINVLLGDMSLVGPRPEVPEYTDLYHGDELLIFSMRPGITDYASIEFADLDDRVGHDDPDAFFQQHILPKKNALRVKYVKNWSLSEDMKILWNTFLRVVRRILKK